MSDNMPVTLCIQSFTSQLMATKGKSSVSILAAKNTTHLYGKDILFYMHYINVLWINQEYFIQCYCTMVPTIVILVGTDIPLPTTIKLHSVILHMLWPIYSGAHVVIQTNYLITVDNQQRNDPHKIPLSKYNLPPRHKLNKPPLSRVISHQNTPLISRWSK